MSHHCSPSTEETLLSLQLPPSPPVPADTARVARAALPQGHPSLTLRDVLGTICQDEDFGALCPSWGQPGLPPWRLALVTMLQCREHLADRQAAEAVRARIDWKYLRSLALTDPGCDFSVLSAWVGGTLARGSMLFLAGLANSIRLFAKTPQRSGLLVSKTFGYCWRTYFNETRPMFQHRLLQALGSPK